MKKSPFYILLVLASLSIISCTKSNDLEETLGSAFVHIPDNEFEKELIRIGIDTDGIINQSVRKRDVENVERLHLNNTSPLTIKNLKGIEGFVGLKRLFASGNGLTSIDLSNNVLLDTINLSVNYLRSIEGLSTATNLKWLSLSYNSFTEFSIDNSSVRNILMSDNELVSFDASKVQNLRSALLTLNKITALDFSKNPLLKVLVFSANKLRTINLDSNLNLEYIYCSSNLLTTFDVSKLNKLVDLRVDRNPYLNCIKVASGQNISTLKLSSYQQANVNCN